MAIAIRSGGSLTGSSTNGGNVTINLPAGTAAGDVVYVMATTNGLPSMNTTGYTQVTTAAFNAGAENAVVFRKVMGATPDTTCVINGTGSQQDSMSAVLYVLTGVDTTTPEDVASPTAATGSSVNPNPPAITTITRTAWVLAYAATDVVNTISSYPSGYSGGISINANDNNDTTAAVAYKSVSPAGAEDPGTYTINATANWGAMTVAVRPSGFISVPVTGVSGTGETGTVQLKLGIGVSTTGVSGTGQVGTVTFSFPRSVSVTGVSATGAVGTVAIQGNASVATTGVSGAAEVGFVEINENELVNVTGVYGTGALGSVDVTLPGFVDVTGVAGTGQVGTLVWQGAAVIEVEGVYGVTQLGNAEATILQYVRPTGVSGTAQVGTLKVYTGLTIFIQGVYCTAQAYPAYVWITINDEEVADWVEIPV